MRTITLLLLALLILPAAALADDLAEPAAPAEPADPAEPSEPAAPTEPSEADAIPVGLTGTWLVDNEASDPVDPLLELLGRNALMRAMAKRIKKITHTIEVDSAGISVRIEAGPRTESTRSEFGQVGSAFVLGDTYDVLTRIEAGAVLKTATLSIDGEPIDFRAVRSLHDPDTMHLDYTLTPQGGEPVRVHRVFRRIPGA